MGIDLRKDHPQTAQHAMAIAGAGEQPTGLRLGLLIDAPESIAALVAYLNERAATAPVSSALHCA